MEMLTLRALRVNLGLSLEEASIMIGVSKDTLSNYERGSSYPTVPIIKRIEDVYKVTFDKINFLLNNDGLTDIKENEGV